MSVWDEKPTCSHSGYTEGRYYKKAEMNAWLEKIQDRHLQLIEENNERREKIGILFDAFQETNNQLKEKKEHVGSLKSLNKALLTAIDLERKINADLKGKLRALQSGEITKEEYYEMKNELMQTLVELAEGAFEMLGERRK